MITDSIRDYLDREYPRREPPSHEVFAMQMLDGHVYRERIPAVLAASLLRRMKAMYPALACWIEEDGDVNDEG